jgi:hypothetical protein
MLSQSAAWSTICSSSRIYTRFNFARARRLHMYTCGYALPPKLIDRSNISRQKNIRYRQRSPRRVKFSLVASRVTYHLAAETCRYFPSASARYPMLPDMPKKLHNTSIKLSSTSDRTTQTVPGKPEEWKKMQKTV